MKTIRNWRKKLRETLENEDSSYVYGLAELVFSKLL
jgi:hypothetical protein